MGTKILNIFTLNEEEVLSFLGYLDSENASAYSSKFSPASDAYLTAWATAGPVFREFHEVIRSPPFVGLPGELLSLSKMGLVQCDQNLTRIRMVPSMRASYLTYLKTEQDTKDFYRIELSIQRALISDHKEIKELGRRIIETIRAIHTAYGLEVSWLPWKQIQTGASGNWPLVGTRFRGFDVLLVVISKCYSRNPNDEKVSALKVMFSQLSGMAQSL